MSQRLFSYIITNVTMLQNCVELIYFLITCVTYVIMLYMKSSYNEQEEPYLFNPD